MKSIISFIEDLGRNADLRLDRVDFESILKNDDFDPEARKAILNKDHKALEMILNARSKIVCMIFPAEEENDDDDMEENDDNNKERKNDDNKKESIKQEFSKAG